MNAPPPPTSKVRPTSTSVVAWLGLAIALLGGVPGVIAIKNEFDRVRVEVAYNETDTLVGKIASDRKERFGKYVIAFYGLQFVGGEFPTTIRTLEFYSKTGWWRWTKGRRIALYTNTVGGTPTQLILGNTKDSIVMNHWINFREGSHDYYIERGKVIPFNVAFMFDRVEHARTNKWQFVITDFSGVKYKTTINSPKYFALDDKNMLVFDSYLGKPEDVQELLQDRKISYWEIQSFLTSRYGYKPDWYD